MDRIINRKGLKSSTATTEQEKAQNPGFKPLSERTDIGPGGVAGYSGPLGQIGRADAAEMPFGMRMQRGFDNMVGKFALPQTSGSWGNPAFMKYWSTLSRGGGMIAQGLYGGGNAGGVDLKNPRVKEAYDFFRSQGYSAAAAAGIVANLWHESKLDPGAVGD